MKKNLNKIIAVILAVILASSCLCTVGMAATADTVKQYGKAGGYLAIGDSISRGCGCTGFYMDRDKAPSGGQYDLYEMRNVEGALPYQIAQAVGCTAPVDMEDQNATYWPFCYPGMTLGVTMDLLGIEDNFSDTALDYPYYDSMLKYFGYEGSFDGVREKNNSYVEGECGLCGNIIDLIKNSDLITLQLGMCDVFYRAYRVSTRGGFLADGWGAAMQNTDSLLEVVKTALGEMAFGYAYFETFYPVLLEKIIELNPDADIVIVGAFNVVNELTINDEILVPVGSAVSLLTEAMNNHYKEWAKKYGVRYADVSNTEILAAKEDWSLLGEFIDNTFTGTHPDQDGYDYMVRQILNVLPEEGGSVTPVDNKNNIVVDLGRFDKVDYVLVDGKKIDNYTLNGFEITIPYSGLVAKNLTVGVINEDGTLSVQTYAISYNGGYTAYRIIGTNDTGGTIKSFFDMIKSFFQMIIDAIKGLFS